MKVLGVVIAATAVVAILLVIGALPTMLILGALHSSDGMSWVPALGFWQVLGSLWVISAIGGAFNSSKVQAANKK